MDTRLNIAPHALLRVPAGVKRTKWVVLQQGSAGSLNLEPICYRYELWLLVTPGRYLRCLSLAAELSRKLRTQAGCPLPLRRRESRVEVILHKPTTAQGASQHSEEISIEDACRTGRWDVIEERLKRSLVRREKENA